MRATALAAFAVAAVLSAMASPPARAGGFSVNPIHLELKPGQNATSLTVANYNTEPMFMQVRVYRWEHRERDDLLTEPAGGDAPLITPPLFRLAPGGGSQVIRIGFPKQTAAPTAKRQWRVIVEEVPQAAGAAQAVGDSPAMPISIAVHVRVSLPLLQRPQIVSQDMEWSLERAGPGSVKLTAQNLGSVTERLDEIHLGAPGDDAARVPGPVYVFPGERRTFELRPQAVLPGGSVHLSVQGTPRPLMRELQLSAQ